jgi:hypothetical protein
MVQILNLPLLKNVAKRKNEKMRRENGKRIEVSCKIDLQSWVVLRPETKGGPFVSGLLGLPREITL